MRWWKERPKTAIALAVIMCVTVAAAYWTTRDGDPAAETSVEGSSLPGFPTRGSLAHKHKLINAAAAAWRADQNDDHERPQGEIEVLWAGMAPVDDLMGVLASGPAQRWAPAVMLASGDVAAVVGMEKTPDSTMWEVGGAAEFDQPPVVGGGVEVIRVSNAYLFNVKAPDELSGVRLAKTSDDKPQRVSVTTHEGMWVNPQEHDVVLRLDDLKLDPEATTPGLIATGGPFPTDEGPFTALTSGAVDQLFEMLADPVQTEIAEHTVYAATQGAPSDLLGQAVASIEVLGAHKLSGAGVKRDGFAVRATVTSAGVNKFDQVAMTLFNASGVASYVTNDTAVLGSSPPEQMASRAEVLAAAVWRPDDDADWTVLYAGSTHVTRVEIRYGTRLVTRDARAGLVPLALKPDQPAPPVSVIGYTKDGTVVPSYPVI